MPAQSHRKHSHQDSFITHNLLFMLECPCPCEDTAPVIRLGKGFTGRENIVQQPDTFFLGHFTYTTTLKLT